MFWKTAETSVMPRSFIPMLIAFLCGFTVCANISILLDLGRLYEAEWGNVVFAVALTVFASWKLEKRL